MPDIAEQNQNTLICIIKKGAKFTSDHLIALLKSIVDDNKKDQSKGDQFKQHKGQNKQKVSVGEIAEQGGSQATLTVFDHDKLFDDVMKKYGVKYAVQEQPLLDENGKQVFDDSKCKYVMNDDGTPKLDYSKCKVEIDATTGQPKLGKDGNPILAPDSPKPEKILAPGSPKPKPMKKFIVVFEGRNTEIMKLAYQEFEQRREQKIEKEQTKQANKEEKAEEKFEKRYEKEKGKFETHLSGDEFEQYYGKDNVESFKVRDPEKFRKTADELNLNYSLDVKKGANGKIEYHVTFLKKDKLMAEDVKKISKKVNIKKWIEKQKQRMPEVNKNNPEKHHNRGAQSL